MTGFLTTFLRVYRETQEILQLHFVCLFVCFSNFFFCPNCHSKSESRPREKRSLPHLQHLLPGQTQTRTHVLVSPELANSTSSQPLTKRALIRMPALSAQLPRRLRRGQSGFRTSLHRKDFWQPSMLCLVTQKAGGTFLMTGGPHLSRSQDHPQNGEGNALMVKTGRKAKMALDSVQGPN